MDTWTWEIVAIVVIMWLSGYWTGRLTEMFKWIDKAKELQDKEACGGLYRVTRVDRNA